MSGSADQSAGSGTAPAGRVPTWLRRTLLVAASALVFVVGMVQAGRDAPTVDEGVDLSSGVSAITERDLRMVPEHPPLPRVLAALPAVVLADPVVPLTPAWEDGDWFDWSDDFIAANEEAGRLDDLLLAARAVVLLEVLGCAALLFVLGRRWFGPDGGLVVALAWLATPYVVGLGHFAMIDLPFVLVTLGFSVLLGRWNDRPTIGRAVALGAVLAAALTSRHTGLVLAVLAAGLMAHRLRREPRQAAEQVGVAALVAVVGTWLVYRGLAPGGSSSGVQANFEGLISSQGSASLPARLVGALPLPLEWRAGFAYLDLTSVPRPSSLLGQSWDGGRWWYFPVSAVLKLPWLLTAGIVAGWVVAVRRGRSRRSLAAEVVLPAVALWLFLVAQPLNLGLRLAMPTVALAYVGLGALVLLVPAAVPATADRRRPAPVAAAIAVALALCFGLMVWSSPHSLAWTQVPFTPAYRWVSDSNLDAGQGLNELRDWLDDHPDAWVAVDRTRGLEVGGTSRPLLDADPAELDGWVAVGVTPLMQTRRDELAWLRGWCSVGELAGGSILVYRFDEPPGPAPGPERPVAPCFGADASSAG